MQEPVEGRRDLEVKKKKKRSHARIYRLTRTFLPCSSSPARNHPSQYELQKSHSFSSVVAQGSYSPWSNFYNIWPKLWSPYAIRRTLHCSLQCEVGSRMFVWSTSEAYHGRGTSPGGLYSVVRVRLKRDVSNSVFCG